MKKKLFYIINILLVIFMCNGCSVNKSVAYDYLIINKNSKKVHYPQCVAVDNMSEKNKIISTKSMADLLSEGCISCNICKDYNNVNKKDIINSNMNYETELMIGTSSNGDINLKTFIDEYEKILKKEYNFLPFEEKNNKILNILSKLYLGINEVNDDYYLSNVDYHKILASMVYHNNNDTKNRFTWKVTAGLYNNEGDIKKYLKQYLNILFGDAEYEYGKGYIEHLINSVKQQHDLSSEQKNDNDFAHMCATLSANLHKNTMKKFTDSYASYWHGIDDTVASCGYIGDICGVDGAYPSMHNDDYRADLDAVNIAYRYKNKKNATLYHVFCEYYNGIYDGSVNRAREFLTHENMEKLYNYRDKYIKYLKSIDNYKENDIEYINAIHYFDNFLANVKNYNNDFKEKYYFDYYEYDQESGEILK